MGTETKSEYSPGLAGVSLVDLPDEMHADERVEDAALNHGLLVSATHSTADGYAGDEVLLAPAFTSTDEELEMMVLRFGQALADVARSLAQG